MFEGARHEAQKCVRLAQSTSKFNMTLSPQFLPNKYSLAAIATEVLTNEPPEDLRKRHEIILLLNSCLSQNKRLLRQPSPDYHLDDGNSNIYYEDEINVIQRMMLSVSKTIRPDGNFFISKQLSDGKLKNKFQYYRCPPSVLSLPSKIPKRGIVLFKKDLLFNFLDVKQTALGQIRHIGELGLSCILCLHSLLPEDHEKKIDDHVIISLLAFTSASDPWTTQTSLDLTNHLLSIYRTEILEQDFIKNSVLTSFIRPLFSASKPKAITSSGYATIPSYTPQEPHDFSAWDLASKPWRLDACYALSVILWIVNHSSQEVILTVFHLIMPPVLILLDSPNTEVQFEGLKILNSFIHKLTPKLLEQTGLGAVIEDAIYPILLYQPPFTPKDECLSILPMAFKSFFKLFEVRFSFPTNSNICNHDQVKDKQKIASLTRLLRQAIAPAYNHTSISSESDPIIKNIILAQIPPLVRSLGIHSVVHLQALLRITEDSLLDPFAASSLPTMLAALKALKEIILCAWPRLSEERRRKEVIRMMVSAWRKISDEKNTSTEAFREEVLEELKISGRLFVKAVEASNEADLACDLNALVEIDKSLEELFGL